MGIKMAASAAVSAAADGERGHDHGGNDRDIAEPAMSMSNQC
jgi:hypothetical protein